MSAIEDFLSPDAEAAIVAAIQSAEQNTSGEIRVHIENHTDLKPLERAQEVFVQRNMHQTSLRNGVLFYVGVSDHSFAIIGDQGIHNVVESDFWECTKDKVIAHFKKKQFKEGLIEGILNAGDKLKQHFPYQSDDSNELSNEISKG